MCSVAPLVTKTSFSGETMDEQLKKGLLEGCVLRCIRGQPSYGYKIIDDLLPLLEVSESTLYPVLKRLETQGLVNTYTQEYNGRLRKYYAITSLGIMALDSFREKAQKVIKITDFIIGGNQ